MADVLNLPVEPESLNAKQTIAEAAKRDWEEVIVIGYVDGKFSFHCSRMSRASAAFIAQEMVLASHGMKE